MVDGTFKSPSKEDLDKELVKINLFLKSSFFYHLYLNKSIIILIYLIVVKSNK